MKKLYVCQNSERQVISMAVHYLAGTKVRKEDYIDLQAIKNDYTNIHPDPDNPHQQVRLVRRDTADRPIMEVLQRIM